MTTQYPTDSQDPLSAAAQAAQNTNHNIKVQAASTLAALQAGSVSANLIIQVLTQAIAAKTALTKIAALQGLDAYVAAQYPNLTITATTALANVVTQIDGVTGWIITNFPASGGYILKDQIDATSGITTRAFTSAQTAGLQTALSNLIAAIN